MIPQLRPRQSMTELSPELVERWNSKRRENGIVEGHIGLPGVEQDTVAIEDHQPDGVTGWNRGRPTHGWRRAISTMVFQRALRSPRSSALHRGSKIRSRRHVRLASARSF